ncbi:MAG: NupC/NupG family nucleoside CNT transporter [Proteobacteria bacterium]|nr:NupC/NupG family nucleoside CNT transporter [Pseudomonadota bacterium]
MERWIGLLGIAGIVAVSWLASARRRAVDWRTVGVALGVQFLIAFAVLRTAPGRALFVWLNDAVLALTRSADAGIEFVFGAWPAQVMGVEGDPVSLPQVFAFRVLPILIFMSSLFGVLQHYGILQRLVRGLALLLHRSLRISGAESLATAANVFFGMTEAPVMIRPYVAALTRSELFLVMTAGLSTVAGTVLVAYMGLVGPEHSAHLIAASFMSAPAAVALAKLWVPEQDEPKTLGGARIDVGTESVNAIDAAAQGAAVGLRLSLNIGAMLVAFVALIHLLNALLGAAGSWFGAGDLTFEALLGYLLAPVAFALGVPAEDALRVGELLGVKTVLNEFVAYEMLSSARAELSPRSLIIASYALCGFANLGSIAILIGGLGGLAPERRADIARDGLRAVAAGSLATFLTGAIAGLLL